MTAAEKWGLPPWREPSAYGDTKSWSDDRWRWEFTRRRDDYRRDFEAGVPGQIEYIKLLKSYTPMLPETCEGCELTALPILPGQPGFYVKRPDGQPDSKYGLGILYDPTLSYHPLLHFERFGLWRYAMRWEDDTAELHVKLDAPVGTAAFVFDLSKPLEPQLTEARSRMERAQVVRFGKVIERRKHPAKWLRYLRVLDAREHGATWSEIARIVLQGENVSSNEQSARQVHEQAGELMFNWPY